MDRISSTEYWRCLGWECHCEHDTRVYICVPGCYVCVCECDEVGVGERQKDFSLDELDSVLGKGVE